MSIWSTQYDSVSNKDIRIDAKKTHTQNGRVLVHYHPRIGETVDIRITPPVLRSSRPVHTAAADFSTQRSLPPHLTNPIFTPVQRTGPFYAGAAPYPAAADPLYGVLRIQQSISSTRTTYAATYGSGPSLLRSTQHTAVTLFVRSLQQSLFFYAAYSSHFYAAYNSSSHSFSTQQSLLPPMPPLLFSGHHLCCLKEGTGSAHVSDLLNFLRFAP